MGNSIVLVIGGPNTGKTNYLSRLWLAMTHATGIVRKDVLPPQIDYIESGARSLLAGRFAERTPRGSFNKVELPFRVGTEGVSGVLVLPDVSGEDCSRVYLERKWGKDWESCISECVGCLVFLREGALVDPLSWIDVQPLLAIGPVLPVGDVAMEQIAGRDSTVPTQTLLVEWLQFLRHAFDEKKEVAFVPRVGLVVAAWDLLGEEIREDGPASYVAKHAPLLNQYIAVNESRMVTRVFGASVVGGDLDVDAEFRDKFLMHDPNESGYVVFEGGDDRKIHESSDITIPLAWVLGHEGNALESTSDPV